MFTYLIIFIVLVGVAVFIADLLKKKSVITPEKPVLTGYERKPYLLDTNSEFRVYKILLELFGDKYLIFPQINYDHLIQPKKSSWAEERRLRSRIDRKSADFVMCDRDRIIPLLIIELDGSVHSYKSKQARDEFIDEITKTVDLPILHIKTTNLDVDFIKRAVDLKLNNTEVHSK